MLRMRVILVPHLPSASICRDIPLSSSIEDKICWANDNNKNVVAAVAADDEAASLLYRLRGEIERTRTAAALTGIGTFCTICERDGSGSCCGGGIEDHYDGRLLLVNRLLGVQLPKSRLLEARCYFLAETGCVLRARHIICVNYICGNVVERINSVRLAELRVEEGIEQETIFRLHDRLTRLSL